MVNLKKERPREHPAGSSAPQPVEPATRTIFSLSEEETFEFGRAFARELRGGELILLDGDLGVGKTVFARGVATGLGVAPEDVVSPSYTLIQEYKGGRLALFHVDLYRIESNEDLTTLGLEDILSATGIVIVEWGAKLPPFLRRGAFTVRFHDIGEGSRQIELQPAPAPEKSPSPQSDA